MKLCECDCGGVAPIATMTARKHGAVKGQPQRFVVGHATRKFHIGRIESYGVRTESGCLLWPFSAERGGYGVAWADGRKVRLTRMVLAKKLGRDLLAGEHACHICDTPACYEAEHIFAGTNAENQMDSAVKGRKSRKLSETSVRAIRAASAAGQTQDSLAELFGVTTPTISLVVNRKRWAWLHEFPSPESGVRS